SRAARRVVPLFSPGGTPAARIRQIRASRLPESVSAPSRVFAQMATVSSLHGSRSGIMNKRALIVLLMSGTVALPALADDDTGMPKEGAIGFGSGIAIGAAAGGPIGAAIGAAVGAWFGERLHEEKTGRRESEAKVAALTEHAGSLESRLAGNERELN